MASNGEECPPILTILHCCTLLLFLLPVESMSMGFLVEENEAVVWRGLMVWMTRGGGGRFVNTVSVS